MTKEEILEKHLNTFGLSWTDTSLNAMDEYAKELFISLTDIMCENDFQEIENGFNERVYDRLIKKLKS